MGITSTGTMRRSAAAATLLMAALGGTALAGCGTGPQAPNTVAAPASESSAQVPQPSTPADSASSDSAKAPESEDAAQPQRPGDCKAGELSVKLVPGDAGAGHVYSSLRFTNTGSRECTLQGSPGVSFVTGDTGVQVGKPADREPKEQGTLVRLAPGKSASSELNQTNTANYDPAQCKEVQARGLRVYAPGDTAAMFVDKPQPACSALPQSQLSVKALH